LAQELMVAEKASQKNIKHINKFRKWRLKLLVSPKSRPPTPNLSVR